MNDHFEDDEEFSVELSPMMLLNSAISNAVYGGLTTKDLCLCSDVANEDDDLINVDRTIRYDHAIDAQIRLMEIVRNHYGRNLPEVVLREDSDAAKINRLKPNEESNID